MRTWIAAMAAALALGAGHAGAQEGFTPAPGFDGAELTLNSHLNRDSRLSFIDVCGVNAVHANVQVTRVDRGERWTPTVSFAAVSGQDVAVMQLWARQRWHQRMENYDMSQLRAPAFTLVLASRNGQGVDMEEFSRPVALGEVIDISLEWTAEGEVIARSRGEERRVRLARPVTDADIYAYNSEARVTALRIGRSAAPLGPCPEVEEPPVQPGDRFIANDMLRRVRLILDTDEGGEAGLAMGNACGVDAIRGTVTAARFRRRAETEIAGEIILEGTRGSATFALRSGGSAEAMTLSLSAEGSGGAAHYEFIRTLQLRETAPFALAWSAERGVRAWFGDEVHSLAPIGSVEAIRFANASGETAFEDMSFGNWGGTPSGCVEAK